MNTIFMIITCVYMILALAQTLIAPKIGPNPYFGFRIGYTFSNKEVWKKSNRFIGVLMLIHSFLLVPFSFLNNSFFIYYMAAFMIPLVAIIIIGFKYSSHQLEALNTTAKISTEPIKPLKVSFIWKHLGLILFLILLFLMSITYNLLPETIATHFNSNGIPNGWESKSTFFMGYIAISLIYLIIIYIIIYAGKKYPIVVHSGIMHIGKDTMFKTGILAMNLVILIFIFTYLGIFIYNVGKTSNPAIINSIVGISLILALSPILYIIYRWKKEKKVVT